MRSLFIFCLVTIFAFANIGNIGALTGEVKILRKATTLTARSGMVLKEKDQVNTAAKSRVQIILKDNTIVTVGAKSVFTFDKYRFTGKKDSEVKMRINRGFFRSVTGKIGKIAPERFKVKTVSATIGIRGTDFSAEVKKNLEKIICYRGGLNVVIDDINHNVDGGMLLNLLRSDTGMKIMTKKISEEHMTKKENNDKETKNTDKEERDEIQKEIDTAFESRSSEALSDITQQEHIAEEQKPLDTPTVEFLTQ